MLHCTVSHLKVPHQFGVIPGYFFVWTFRCLSPRHLLSALQYSTPHTVCLLTKRGAFRELACTVLVSTWRQRERLNWCGKLEIMNRRLELQCLTSWFWGWLAYRCPWGSSGFEDIQTPPSWEVCKVCFRADWLGFGCLQYSWSTCMGFGTVDFNYYCSHGLRNPNWFYQFKQLGS